MTCNQNKKRWVSRRGFFGILKTLMKMEELMDNENLWHIQEHIFGYLDHKTVEICRKVCKTWKESLKHIALVILLQVKTIFPDQNAPKQTRWKRHLAPPTGFLRNLLEIQFLRAFAFSQQISSICIQKFFRQFFEKTWKKFAIKKPQKIAN